MNRAYRRVKANGGAPGADGMTIEGALPWLKEHKDELIGRIRRGKYTPTPVRRVEIPKPEGGIRKLGIPTVIDRIIQQAIAPVSYTHLDVYKRQRIRRAAERNIIPTGAGKSL